MDMINWEQVAAQATVVGLGVGAVTYLVRNAMATYWTKMERQAQQLQDYERRFGELDKRNELGDAIHREHDKDIAALQSDVKDAHKRLDRAGA